MFVQSSSTSYQQNQDFQSNNLTPDPKAREIPFRSDSTKSKPQYTDFKHEIFVLIVDDDRYIGELLGDLLQDAGYRVKIAHDGNEAYSIACQDVPSLILTDYMMPECDGVGLTQLLRSNPVTRSIPVVMMSSARPRLPDLESIPFLPKPFDFDDVITVVDRHANRQFYPHGEG